MVFFIAGLLKLMDPVGAGLVVEEYLKFMHLGFLQGIAGPVAVALAFLESVTGALLVMGVFRILTAMASMCFLVFFTTLTLVLVIVNPQMDCGCFGEALHLTHAQTFVKNLVLCVLWAVAFVPLKSDVKPQRIKYVTFPVILASLVLFMFYSLMSLPLVDYTPLKAGTEIGEDELSFYDVAGDYRDSLAASGNVAVISIYAPEKMHKESWARVSQVVDEMSGAGLTPIVLAATVPSEVEAVVGDASLLPLVFFADKRMLQTLNRSNAGVTLIQDGMIVGKWAARSVPRPAVMSEMVSHDPIETALGLKSSGRMKLQGFLLYSFAVMLLL